MKKNIVVGADAQPGWIGGLYYRKNIVFTIAQNPQIIGKYRIIILTTNNTNNTFDDLPKSIKVLYNPAKNKIAKRLYKYAFLLSHRAYCYCFPNAKHIPGCKFINWIPDFQHKYYPEYFSSDEIIRRNNIYTKISNNKEKVILSSNTAKEDFIKYYNADEKNTFVIPFVSYIVPEIRRITDQISNAVLSRFGLVGKQYIVVVNQFWQHKNHLVVLEAMKKFYASNPRTGFKFVFTGELVDHRKPEYIERIKKLFEESEIKDHSVLLGFIDRNEQIAIMKQAEFIIQPSLFEGWGTVVEDAKVLDKTILLSDIPVHREQMNEKCILFDPHNADILARLIEEECKRDHCDDIEKGIENMYKRAKEYSKGFEQLILDLETKK